MRNYVGVWVDQCEAHLLRPAGDEIEMKTIYSEVEPHHRSTGGKGKSKPYLHERGDSSEKHADSKRKNALKKFYTEIASSLVEVDEIFLLGPGTAKEGLRAHLIEKDSALGGRISAENAPRMTHAQLKQKILSHFGAPAKRKLPKIPGQPGVVAQMRL